MPTHSGSRDSTPASPCGVAHDFSVAIDGPVRIPAWPLPRRRMHLTRSTSLATENRARPEIPGDHRPVQHGARTADAGSAFRIRQEGGMRRSLDVFETLAVPFSPTRPRQEAHEAYRTRTLAAGARRPGDGRVRHRPDPQRRLPRRRQRPRGHEHPLPLLEHVGGHHRPVHRCPRRSRHPVDAVEQEDRLDLPQGRDRPSRHIHRAEGPARYR